MKHEQTEGKTYEELKEILTSNNFVVSIGNHGLIFVTPLNKGAIYKREFESMNDAYTHYYSYLIK